MTLGIELEEELAKTRMSRKVAHRLRDYIWPYRGSIGLCLVGELIWVLSMGCNALIVERGVRQIQLYGDYSAAVYWAGMFLVNALIRLVLIIVELRVLSHCGIQFLNHLRKDLFDHIQTLSIRYYDKTQEGRIISRVDRDVESLRQTLVWGPLIFASAIYSLIWASVLMCLYHWKLWLCVASVIPVLSITTYFFQKAGMKAYRRVRESLSMVSAFLAESINGVRVLQGFSRQQLRQEEFSERTEAHVENVVRAAIIWNAYLPSISTCYSVAILIVIGYGGALVNSGELEVSALVAFIMLIGLFFWPIEGIGDLYNQSLSAASSAERIFLLLDTEPEIVDSEQAIQLETVRGELRFQHVSFAYDENKRDDWSLQDIDFFVPAGTSVALVGHTGAGKSSIVNLTARFYEPLDGHVLIDGIDLQKIQLHSLHAHMGIVLQENFLFSGTVMDNLLYGNDRASRDDAIAVLEKLGAEEILQSLSHGLDTEVKERGAGLSQGERQLICFARAMIADPSILILDEATSSVDSKTEAVIQQALEILCEHRTTMIVAHRLSTIRNADLILVLEQGQIIERGTHDELMKKKSSYYTMYRQYLKKGAVT